MRRILLLVVLLSPPFVLSAPEAGLDTALEERAQSLIHEARADNIGYQLIESLTTEVGPRLAGTDAELRARKWAVARLKTLGFSNVGVETFELPVWTRGVESAEVLSPYPQPLTITALGGSVATGANGVSGQLVSFTSLAALKAADAAQVKDRIVFVDEAMTRTQDGSGYSVAAAKRREAAYVSEQLGARAVLIRSVGTGRHRFAHTGQMRRVTDLEGQASGVPAAALSAPDADQLKRMLQRGPVELKLTLTPETRPGGESANVIAEIPGRDFPGEIVLVGAHLDSWDLGTGAVDDGAGVGIIVAAAKKLRDSFPQGLSRTIRVVLFGAEEVGLAGAKAYAEQHAAELGQHVIASESDFGAGRVWRFETRVSPDSLSLARAIGAALAPLGVAPGGNEAYGGPDMKYIREAGVPVVTLKQNGWDYFDLHHTPDDTLDKIDAEDINQNVAAWVGFLYLAAETRGDFRQGGAQ